MFRLLYLAAILTTLVAAPRRGLVPRYRWFYAYTCLLFGIQASRLMPNTVWYTRYIWSPLEIVATVLLVGASLEAFQAGFYEAYNELLGATFLLAVACCGSVPWYFERDPRWTTALIQVRDYIQILAGSFLSINLLVIHWHRLRVPAQQRRHLAVVASLTGWQAVGDVVYLSGGKWNLEMRGLGWWGVEGLPVLGSAACYAIWITWVPMVPLLRLQPTAAGGVPRRAAPR